MGGIEHAMDPVRRVLGHKVSVGGLIELELWSLIPYLCIGFAWPASPQIADSCPAP